jgi:hypothetical protein
MNGRNREVDMKELAPQGIGMIPWPQESSLADLATEIGIAARDHRLLRPRLGGAGSTLSDKHGLGSFPWHTDGAVRPRPPRWILMRSLSPCKTPTLLVSVSEVLCEPRLRCELTGGVWLVQNGRRSFHSSVLCPPAGAIRWNPDVMQARGARAREAENGLLSALGHASPREHYWNTNEALLLDNWSWLHSRPIVATGDSTRELERIHGD